MPDSKSEALPIVLIAGLNCSARLYAEQIPALWPFGPVIVADHTRDDSMAAMARRILADAPPRFALAGLSMGGYIAFEIMRQAPQRVAKLALLDTGARAEVPERTEQRTPLIALAKSGRFMEIFDSQYPTLVHRSRHNDAALAASVRDMNEETGPQAYLRQQQAIITRPDSRPGLAAITCPTLVLVGDSDEPTPPDLAREMAAGIAGACLVVVPECGHLSTMERPAEVNAALVEWMRSR
ncbi:MAG TPA: alpha/beta fold hydrolase [Xanthobacteraceae bacterium]|nr:alpha/beta fold hydrolase [Xanthobacteraceae bacterium]